MNVEQVIKVYRGLFDSRLFNVLGMFGQLGAAGLQAAANTAMNSATNAANERIAKDTNDANIKMTEKTNQMNYLINERTNALNKQIADEANRLNLQMFQEQNDWNLNMWEKNNAYNSPEQQLQRLIEAGINPNMAGSSVGGSVAGNSGSPAESANWNGAETATMNPIQLEAPHIDPYKLIPNQVDFLPALAQAAGVADVQASTELKKQEYEFNPREYADSHEMKVAMIKNYMEQTKDLKLTRAGRLRQARIASDLYEAQTRAYEQEIQQRKDAFEWTKSLRPFEVEKLRADLAETYAVVHKMTVEETVLEAQKHHWINEDTSQRIMAVAADKTAEANLQNANTNEFTALENDKREDNRLDAEIENFKQRLSLDRFDALLKSYNVGPDTRRSIANALYDHSHDNFDLKLSEFIRGLEGARDGNFNNLFQTIWHLADAAAMPWKK